MGTRDTDIDLKAEQEKHIFGFALENVNIEPGYVSEKIYQAPLWPSQHYPLYSSHEVSYNTLLNYYL